MVRTASMMPDLGMAAPDFALPDTEGRIVSLADFTESPALLVAFLCSHCEHTKHIQNALADFARTYASRGLATLGINANDASYPEDAPEHMKAEAARAGYDFPYLFDESQKVAQAFGAACTPDFFLFDDKRRLAYRGQFDSTRPGKNVPATGADLRAAVDAVLAHEAPPSDQRPSVGCNIKWRRGNEPDYFQPGVVYRMWRYIGGR